MPNVTRSSVLAAGLLVVKAGAIAILIVAVMEMLTSGPAYGPPTEGQDKP